MNAAWRRAVRAPVAVLAACVLVAIVAPMRTLADGDLAVGSPAVTVAGVALLRVAPGYDAEVAGELPPGTQVTPVAGPMAATDGSLWYEVDAGGYLPASALAPAPAGDGESAPPDAVSAATGAAPEPAAAPIAASPTVIAIAYVVEPGGATCYAEMDVASAELGTIPEGNAVDVVGETAGEWQPVLCGGTPGYVFVGSLAWEPPVADGTGATPAGDVAVSDAGGRGEAGEADRGDGGGNGGGGGAGSVSGRDVADFALKYVGHPYVHAGDGPRAFDCSGFTMFVARETLGIDITHDMFVQYDMGTKVDRNDLRPGDFVFFQNTFRRGLSHVGIYVGDGQFVHAENESTGVVVSDLNSDYYDPRWYGAVRYT